MAIRDYINPLVYLKDTITEKEKFYYDPDRKQFVLTIDAANWHTALNLIELWGTEENAEWYLETVSQVVYNAIFTMFKDSKFFDEFRYELVHSRSLIDKTIDILLDSIMYNEAGGGFLMGYETGINLQEMKSLKLEPKDLISTAGMEMIKGMGLGMRVSKTNVNHFEYFDNLEDMLNHLVNNGILKPEQVSDVECITEMPFNREYKFFYIKHIDKYVVEDKLTVQKWLLSE